MSDLLKTVARYLDTLSDPCVQVVSENTQGMEDRFTVLEPRVNMGGHDLEGRSISAVSVGEPRQGRFRYFLDGMQRPRGPFYIQRKPVPFLYGYTAAAVRHRGIDRRMRGLEGAHRENEALYASLSMMNASGIEMPGVKITDIDRPEDGSASSDRLKEHPLGLLEVARDKISTVRGSLERELVLFWLSTARDEADWLLVDGSLDGDYAKQDNANLVGVTKSHGTQYFPWEQQQEILNLRVGERSGIFIPVVSSRRRNVYSWYLRMHPNDGRDMYFGLIRVETPRESRFLEMADEISQWLMAERSPLSLPDARWDKMIYPIRDCEMYLKSRAPSHAGLDAMMSKLAAAGRSSFRL